MKSSETLNYCPDNLLTAVKRHLQLRDDKQLARALNVAPRVLQKIREGQVAVGASLLMWISDASGIAIEELKRLLGDRRRIFRPSCRITIAHS